MTTPSTAPAPVLVDADAVAALTWQPFPGNDDVRYKLLWSSGWSVAGVMHLPPGASLSPHTHRGAHHHLWGLSGEAQLLGQHVGEGTYVHVPTGVEHGISGVGPDGFSMLYLYLRDEPADGT